MGGWGEQIKGAEYFQHDTSAQAEVLRQVFKLIFPLASSGVYVSRAIPKPCGSCVTI